MRFVETDAGKQKALCLEDVERIENPGSFGMNDLVREYLSVQRLHLLAENEFGDAVRTFIEKDERDAIEKYQNKTIDGT
jgi:predicted N-acyltransferase